MTALERVASGPFTISEALLLEDIGREALRPADSLLKHFPALVTGQSERLYMGQALQAEGEDGLVRVYDSGGEFLMLARREAGFIKIEKNFRE